MMNGKPQTLTSKFKISYNLLLNLLDIGDNSLVKFASRSMVTGDLEKQMKQNYYKMTTLNTELDSIKNYSSNLRTPFEVLQQFIELHKNKATAANKKRKEIERQLQQIHDNYKFIEQDNISYQKISIKQNEIDELQKHIDLTNSYIKSGVHSVLNILKEENFIEGDFNDENSLKLTLIGQISSQLKEVHCLVFAKLLENKELDNLSSKQLVSLFSIFTNIIVKDDFKDNYPKTKDDIVKNTIIKITDSYTDYKTKETYHNINTGFDYNVHYDLLNYVDDWCDCEDIEACKFLLQKIGTEKEIFLGEFVKALLKINNISCEMEKIAEMTNNIAFLSKLREIPNMTLKYVVTNQSLYV